MKALWFPALFLAVFPALALNPGLHLSQYGHSSWRLRDGAFAGIPHSITQTADGYLWLATDAGPVRFDGVRFVTWAQLGRPPLRAANTYSVFGDGDGGLWIGNGIGIERWWNGRLTAYPKPGGRILAIAKDRTGNLWAVRSRPTDSEGGLCRISGATPKCFNVPGQPSYSVGSALAIDGQNNVWVGSLTGVCRWISGAATCFVLPGLEHVTTGIEGMTVLPDGRLLVSFAGSEQRTGVKELRNGVWHDFSAGHMDWSRIQPTAWLVDRNQALWIGTNSKGIYRVEDGQVDHFDTSDGLSSDSIEGFYQDREGNLWVTASGGIDQFHDLPVTTFSKKEGLMADSANSVLTLSDGSVWVGNRGGIDIIRGNAVSGIRSENGFPGTRVTSMFQDRSGRVWIGVDDGLDLYDQGRFSALLPPGKEPLGVIIGITQDNQGAVWALTAPGALRVPHLFKVLESKKVAEIKLPPIPRAQMVIASSPKYGIWLSSVGSITPLQNGELRTDAAVSTLGTSRASFVDADGAIWWATSQGAVHVKNGRPETLDSQNGLSCDNINSIVRDDRGSLWLQSPCGLDSIAAAELARWEENPGVHISVRNFGILDGALPGGQVPFSPKAVKSTDGRLWFVNERVLQVVDPAHLHLNETRPPVQIETVIADRKANGPQQNLRLPALTRDIEIDYTALSLSVPQKVQFRYRLEGRDREWRDPGKQRQAFYNDLPPGPYTFRVIAANNDGVWNNEGAAWSFSVAPAYYQKAWFRCLLAGIAILLCWMLYRFRVRQIAAGISARFDERLEERTRIARELHDTLLQTIQGSKLIVDDALDNANDSALTRQALQRLSIWLYQATEEGRAALTSLRRSATRQNDLAEALQRAGEDCSLKRPLTFRLTVDGSSRDMHPIVRDDIYRIGYEAIRNACWHSGGTQVEVDLKYARDLILRVRDNGKGIHPDILSNGKQGHFGLRGMQERADRAGGKLSIRATNLHSTNPGTEVELVVPGNLGYQRTKTEERSLLAKVRRLLWR
jgi:signal transduction histidine kinase/ligand-binding sensor domain-containing protein